MKRIKVVAAIIKNGSKIFATQRGYGEFKDKWEFPGGKVETGESPEEALKREIHEELDATISINKFVTNVSYEYPNFHLDMSCYLCTLESGVTLLEHEAAKWLDTSELRSIEWLPADVMVVDAIENQGII